MTEKSFSETQSKSFNPPYLQPNPRWFCIFCASGNHSSVQCQRYQSSNEFWQKVLVDRRCRNCLRLFHHADKCYNESLCRLKGCNRQDKHNPVLCHVRYRKNKFWSNGYRRHFDNPFPHLNIRDCHFSNYRTCKGNSKLSTISKVHASTQMEIELSTERHGNKVSLGCQTDLESTTNPPVYMSTSKDDRKRMPNNKNEDELKLNYNDHSSEVCSVEDSEKLIRSLHQTQPKTAALFHSLRSLIFQLQQKKIQCSGHSSPN